MTDKNRIGRLRVSHERPAISSTKPSKGRTRTKAPEMAYDQANTALIKLMRAEQATLRSRTGGTAPGVRDKKAQSATLDSKKGGGQ